MCVPVRPSELVSVVYVSSAVNELTPEELVVMLPKIRRRNHERGITGLLLYRGGNFLQVIEGPPHAVDELLENLKKDRRHKGMIVMMRQPIQQREFGEWQMAFRNVTDKDLRSMEGYSNFLELPFASPEFKAKPSQAHKLLLKFRASCR